MIPKRVELTNFLSFAGPVEFRFGDDEPLWVLSGPNGVGKSAVFDAITYVLYGEHRGGAQKVEQLVRHGANGFRIVFEFEFDDIDYRITRTKDHRRPTQKLERRTGSGSGAWEPVPHVNSAKEVAAWVRQTIGLGYEAFTTSVLLQQGKADKLFDSSRDERIALLKGIIGFDQFEQLWQRVHAVAARLKSEADTCRKQFEGVRPITSEEQGAVETALTDATAARAASRAALAASVQRAEQARQWERLESQRAGLIRQLAEADTRAREAESIRADKGRLDDLAATVPVLARVLQLRTQIVDLQQQMVAAEAAVEAGTAERQAKEVAVEVARQKEQQHRQAADTAQQEAKSLHETIEQGTRFLKLAEEIEPLLRKLTEYPVDLPERLVEAIATAETTERASQTASQSLCTAKVLLAQVQEEQQQFANVASGVRCSRCGQLVDEDHAAGERARLAASVHEREAEVARLGTKDVDATRSHTAARKQKVTLEKQQQACDKLRTELDTRRSNLMELGVTADAAELRQQLAWQEKQQTEVEHRRNIERAKQQEAETEWKHLRAALAALATTIRKSADDLQRCQTVLAADRGQEKAALDRLSTDWQARLSCLDVNGVSRLAEERDRLLKNGIAAQFEQLQQDASRRAEWQKRLEEIVIEIADIPEDSRVSAAESERLKAAANTADARAEANRDKAQQAADELKRRAQEHKQRAAALQIAERQHDLHKKLDSLLGQDGLQRELVRAAEQDIVVLANDTLQNLSDGVLSLEPDEEASGRDDKAFALRVRKTGDPYPVGVQFLSGSQRFRVAVSVALAVGRFASGRARPLESVIIDEGFGSLDKDGLLAMAEELKRLQRSQGLRRIVLVSHQEEFTDQFAVGCRLVPGPDGTTVETFRR